MFCKLRGRSDELVLSHEDVASVVNSSRHEDLLRLSQKAGVEPAVLFKFIMGDYKSELTDYYSRYDAVSPVSAIVKALNYDFEAAEAACDDVVEKIFRRSSRLEEVYQTVKSIQDSYDIVYLPTYRRIELALSEETSSKRARTKRPTFTVASGSLLTAKIQFGLSDISERLSDLHEQIIARSNSGYREISENIINELIRGFELTEQAQIPKADDLKLFFSRLESESRLINPYYRISAPDFDRIYSGEGVPPESRKFLSYFLSKLYDVIKITKNIEQPVDEFVRNCNKYLSTTEPSTSLRDVNEHNGLQPFDAKALRLNRANLSVFVESLPAGRKITLDALSSGEKQMISLFAKLYLYPKRKIVLVDEPELSLSIDWQRGILVDVMLAPQCEQIIAITHSPFVFDNSLEPFARSLTLELAAPVNPQLDFDREQ